jgi:hypothetical protein
MGNLVLEEVGTFDEWLDIGRRWNKPRAKPQRDVASLSPAELRNNIVCVYRLNSDRNERDIGLVKPAGSSTPVPRQYLWVCGVNAILK